MGTDGHGGDRGQETGDRRKQPVSRQDAKARREEPFGVRWLDTALDRMAKTAFLTPSREDAKRFSGGATCSPWRRLLPVRDRGNSRRMNLEIRKGGGKTAGLTPRRQACQAEGMGAKGGPLWSGLAPCPPWRDAALDRLPMRPLGALSREENSWDNYERHEFYGWGARGGGMGV